MKNPLHSVKVEAAKALTKLVMQALTNARSELEATASRPTAARTPDIIKEAYGIGERFMKHLNDYFDEIGIPLTEQANSETEELASISQIDHHHLEAIVAMEGMVKQRREAKIAGMQSLVERLESLLPGIRVDETNNPFDPEQIGDCFNEAVKPLELEAQDLRTIFEEFNRSVFGELETIVARTNAMLASLGVLPELQTSAQNSAKPLKEKGASHDGTTSQQVEERPKIEREGESHLAQDSFQSPGLNKSEPARTDRLEHLQQLLHSASGQTHALAQHATKNVEIAPTAELATDAERTQQAWLLNLLDNVQFNQQNSTNSRFTSAATNVTEIAQAINKSLTQAQNIGELGPLPAQSADVINLIVVLFDIIERDEALLAVLKELVGRIRVPIMKIALRDTSFFDYQDNPARKLIDEIVQAGVGWTQPSSLDGNAVYETTKRILKMLLDETEPDDEYIETLLSELRQARCRAFGTNYGLESRVRNLRILAEHPDDVDAYVRQKIRERIRKRELDPFVRTLLKTYIHNFLFKLVTSEGLEGRSWKSAISTLDVLLWTMQPAKQFGDLKRFKRVNPRLLQNLSKFMSVGGASKTKVIKVMRQLKQIQEFTFFQAEAGIRPERSKDKKLFTSRVRLSTRGRKDIPPLKRTDPTVVKIGRLPLDSWIEFRGSSGERLRCALASKIESIDKLFFADSEGEILLEISRLRLAYELKAGTAKIISEGPIMKRAMTSIAAYLSEPSRTGA